MKTQVDWVLEERRNYLERTLKVVDVHRVKIMIAWRVDLKMTRMSSKSLRKRMTFEHSKNNPTTSLEAIREKTAFGEIDSRKAKCQLWRQSQIAN